MVVHPISTLPGLAHVQIHELLLQFLTEVHEVEDLEMRDAPRFGGRVLLVLLLRPWKLKEHVYFYICIYIYIHNYIYIIYTY